MFTTPLPHLCFIACFEPRLKCQLKGMYVGCTVAVGCELIYFLTSTYSLEFLVGMFWFVQHQIYMAESTPSEGLGGGAIAGIAVAASAALLAVVAIVVALLFRHRRAQKRHEEPSSDVCPLCYLCKVMLTVFPAHPRYPITLRRNL